jgi:hypothetical protein
MPFTIVSTLGNYTLPPAKKASEVLEENSKPGRTPGSQTFHVTGDRLINVNTLEFEVRIKGASLAASQTAINDLEKKARAATSVSFNATHTRAVLALLYWEAVPIATGYKVKMRFLPSRPKWTEVSSSLEVTL